MAKATLIFESTKGTEKSKKKVHQLFVCLYNLSEDVHTSKEKRNLSTKISLPVAPEVTQIIAHPSAQAIFRFTFTRCGASCLFS